MRPHDGLSASIAPVADASDAGRMGRTHASNRMAANVRHGRTGRARIERRNVRIQQVGEGHTLSTLPCDRLCDRDLGVGGRDCLAAKRVGSYTYGRHASSSSSTVTCMGHQSCACVDRGKRTTHHQTGPVCSRQILRLLRVPSCTLSGSSGPCRGRGSAPSRQRWTRLGSGHQGRSGLRSRAAVRARVWRRAREARRGGCAS